MKLFFTSVFFIYSFLSSAQTDSTKKVWQFHGTIQVNNNGIAPVPAFSLGKPALMTTLFVSKGQFTYSPELNYGLDGNPWGINHWLRYQLTRGKVTYRTGVSLSLFFQKDTIQKDNHELEITKTSQYTAFEGGLSYKFSDKNSLNLTYWKSFGLDYGTIKSGHFVMLSATFTQIPLTKSLFLNVNPNLFYLNNTAPYEGLFTSAIVNVSHKKYPISLFTQGVQPIWVAQTTKSKWNYGLTYTF
jgi:hypothetical protein